ncbi:hypothetical protein [Marinactinospora rubrisoli]|uniref:Uncharacterized protein n=1 Tax=Marinactinospora rubrisoli TaxID=2715399 RepID=A0ABW2KM49_9ACTN
MTRNRLFPRILAASAIGALSLAVAVGLVTAVGPSLSLSERVLHEESSQEAGVTYEYAGARHASDLLLVRVRRLTGVDHELRIGPGAADYYYPVEVGFGFGDPQIRDVEWQTDGVTVTFEAGDSVHVPADNFRSVR